MRAYGLVKTASALESAARLEPPVSGQRALVTGGAGFIGSNLVDRLLAAGWEVQVYDNFSTGHLKFLESARAHARFRLVRGDLLDVAALSAAVADHDVVFHLAANAGVRL